MRVVLDANVILAALGFRGVCRAVLDACVDAHEVVLSDHLLDEIHRHLQGKLGHSPSMAGERVDYLRAVARIVDPAPIPTDACRDPGDLPVLGTLVSSGADYLVTGDQDLLVLRNFGDAFIVSPRAFWEILREAQA